MISPEQLVNDLLKHNEMLFKELEQAQQDIKDFEKLAVEWRKGYADLERKHRIEIGNLEQTIEELETELDELKNRDPRD